MCMWHIYKLQNDDHYSVSYHLHPVMYLLFLFHDENMNVSLDKNNDNEQYYVEISHPKNPLLYCWP